MPEITKSYEPHDVEEKWYAAWLAAGAFAVARFDEHTGFGRSATFFRN